MRLSLRVSWSLLLIAIAGGSLLGQTRLDKKPLTIAEYARWRSIRDVAISDDGVWASYGYQQRNTDDTLFVKNLSTGAETKIPRATGAQFSDDAHWMAYFVAAPGANKANATGSQGGQGGQGGAQATQTRRVELRNLATGTTASWDNGASFAFAKGSAAMMVRKARAAGAGATDVAAAGGGGGRGGRGGAGGAPPPTAGTDLILHHLKDGSDELIGSVSSAEFNRPGSMLAYTVSSTDRDGNGVYLVSLETGSRRPLDNAKADYARLTWDSAGTALAAFRGSDRRGFTEKENTLLAFSGLTSAEPTTLVLAPTTLAGMPKDVVLSEKGTIVWSADGSKLFVGLREQEARPAVRRDTTVDEEPVANVDIWHWKDDYIQPVQMVRAPQDRNRTLVASVLLAEKTIVPLADARMQTVQIGREGSWGIGRDEKDYVDDWRPSKSDYYRVSTTTGERTPVMKGQERTLGLSADGKYFLYWKDAHVWSYDIAANKHTNITKSAPVSFVNVEEDHVGEKPAYGVTGFTKDGKSVILDHKYDLWLVSLDGSAPARSLTNGEGSKNEIRLRYERIEPPDAAAPPAPGGGGRGGGGAGNVVDLSKPVTLTAFGDRDKKDGFYSLDGDKLTPLVFEDHSWGRAIKARNADRVLVTRETFAEFPDYYVTNAKFTNPTRLTNANPQQAEYTWGHRILFDYKDKDGHKLQGTLAIPDGYKSGQKLPMLVDYYEKNSQNLNRYSVPRYATAPQFADYVSNGYLVMQPDIYYHTGRSHTDMLNSVEAAVKRVIELGYVDPKRVGLHGHSYSGQGSAYIATTSKMFAAVVAGAAAVDLIADFNQLWKTSGTNQHRYDTYGQGRFGTNPYDNLELFMDQSAVFHVKTMDTPLLLLQGTNDGSTEWLQGVEFYNALRFLKKPVIFLSYEGESHGFVRYENQYDVMTRMKQFYDHHLKGELAADWIVHGVPFLKKKTPTGAAAQAVTVMGGGAGIGTPGTGGGGGGGGRGGGGGEPPIPNP
jgi:dipeptidyl aminopeptidase/acylaminoacyl peptidase